MQHLSKLRSAIFALAMLVVATLTSAQIPVTDIANLRQSITDYLVTIKQLQADIQQIRRLEEAFEQTVKQVEAVRGSRGISGLVNNSIIKKYRRELNFDRRLALDNLLQGKMPNNKKALAAGLSGLVQVYNLFQDESRLSRRAREQAKIDYKNRASASAALANSSAQMAMATTNLNLDKLETMLDQIDQTEDIKASSDLNTRMTAEIALLLNQLINLQANALANETERQVSEDRQQSDPAWERGF